MATRDQNPPHVAGQQPQPSTTGPRPLTAAEKTKRSWARRIESYDAVPGAYKPFFEPLLARGCAFPYTVLTPPYEGFLRRATETLVCDLGHEIAFLTRSGHTFEGRSYPLESISYVEVTAILLDSRLTIVGTTSQGLPASSTCKFNSVTDYLFAPILRTIRRAPLGSPGQALDVEKARFDAWSKSSFKFMNYAKNSLLAGETVLQAILQPEIRASEIRFFGRTFYRAAAPTHVVILTDRELILIEEEKRRSGDDRYGGTWDYVPLSKIQDLSLETRGSLLALNVQLPNAAHLESLFSPVVRPELDCLLDRFLEAKRLTPSQAET